MHQSVRPSGHSMSRRGWGWLSMIGRLQSGADVSAARHDLELAAVDIRQRFPDHAKLASTSRRPPACERGRPDRDGADPGHRLRVRRPADDRHVREPGGRDAGTPGGPRREMAIGNRSARAVSAWPSNG